MKQKILRLLLLFLFLSPLCFLLIETGCNDDKIELPPLKDKTLTVIETNSTGCKESLKSSETEQYIELKAEGENQLRIKFINATINCAGLDTTLAIINNGILKVTFIDYILANCYCDFDLECVIDSMEQRKYTAQVLVTDEVFTFTFDYSKSLNSRIEISPN